MRTLKLILACVVGFGVSAAVKADPIVFANPLWYEFSFDGPGSFAGSCGALCIPSSGGNSIFAPPQPWTFTAPTGGILTVTDANVNGDRFEIFDFGVSLGLTSEPAQTISSCSNDPVPCSTDPLMSHGTFALAVGNHSITIQVVLSRFGEGVGYFRTDIAQVPEPGVLLLVLVAMGMLWGGFAGRRKSG